MTQSTTSQKPQHQTPDLAFDRDRSERPSSMRPRAVDYDWSTLPMHYYDGDPQATHFINVLHLLLPEGESWFVRVFAHFLPEVTNPDLRKEVRGFMGQESHHANAHQDLDDYLEAHGIDVERYINRVRFLLRDLGGETPFGIELSPELYRHWQVLRLAIVAALEHYTAHLGGWVVNHDHLDELGMHPVMLDLLLWHSAEEVEHQSVAIDLLNSVAPNNHAYRIAAMGLAAPLLFAMYIHGMDFMMKQDNAAPNRLSILGHIRAVRQRRLPSFAGMFAVLPRFIRRGFHPEHYESATMQRAVEYIVAQHGAEML